MEEILDLLPDALLPWYGQNKRDLPWRRDREPYHVWLSEIMLQQTRVEAVRGYYSRFLAALPTMEALANADDELLLKLWEGLGYYSRVRNLKKAAGIVMERYGGEFPRQYAAVLELPGIGAYTAGAICSIAFSQRTPAVDGNVLRVFSRLTADSAPVDQPAFRAKARRELARIYPEDAGNFTQALMELGATLCGPNHAPQCGECPCRGFCRGYLAGVAAQLPVRAPKRSRRVEEKTVFILSCDGYYALQKRPAKGLLASLWQFPDMPGKLPLSAAVAAVEAMGMPVREVYRQLEKSHIFTHIQWEMRGFYLEVAQMPGDFRWLDAAQMERETALPTAYRQFWQAMKGR